MTLFVLMIDSIRLYMTVFIADLIALPLKDKKLLKDDEGEIVGVRGMLGSLAVKYMNGILSIYGSLSTYYFGNNIEILSLSQVREAIKSIELTLCIDLRDAVITRLDLAYNLPVPIMPEQLYPLFVRSPHYRRFVEKSTLYFSAGKNRKKCFYNKSKEADLKNPNVLRFEIRYTNMALRSFARKIGLGHQLKIRHILNSTVYNSLIDLWLMEYESIEKVAPSKGYLIGSPDEIYNQIFVTGLEARGGVARVMEEIELANAISPFKYPKAKARFKEKLTWACKNAGQQDYELIEILDNAFRAIAVSNKSSE